MPTKAAPPRYSGTSPGGYSKGAAKKTPRDPPRAEASSFPEDGADDIEETEAQQALPRNAVELADKIQPDSAETADADGNLQEERG